MGEHKKITDAQASMLRGAFEEHAAAEFGWSNFRRTDDGNYAADEVQTAWHWCRLGFLGGINETTAGQQESGQQEEQRNG